MKLNSRLRRADDRVVGAFRRESRTSTTPPTGREDDRTFWLIRLMYGRNNRDAPDSGPFATDALVISFGLALFAAMIVVPAVFAPIFGVFLVVVVVRYSGWWQRWRRRRAGG